MSRVRRTSGVAVVHRSVHLAGFLSLVLLMGCATPWQSQGSFYRTAQAKLVVNSKPPGKVYVNNRLAGDSPLTVPLQFQQQVERKTRKVSYWQTQPGWSLLFSALSLGLYVPFSLIPVDPVTALEPRDSFKDNVFQIEVRTDGGQSWKQQVTCTSEQTISLSPDLEATKTP